MTYIAVGVAGVCGGLLRYALGLWLEPLAQSAAFPWATLVCNWSGSFLLAWLLARSNAVFRLSVPLRTALTAGFLGSFTTFSALSAETMQMLREGDWTLALLYVSLSLIGGLCFAGLGGRQTAGRKRQSSGTRRTGN